MSDSAKQGDTTTDFVAEAIPAGKYLVNPYEDWAKGEGVPIVKGRAIDLMAVETRPWARFDCHGAIAHVDGRCDFLSVFLHEITPGKSTAPRRHVYDELCVVLSGEGETEIETQEGKHVVAWGPGALIAPPTNARYRHGNTGAAPARLACFNDLRYLLNLYRSERFIFDNPLVLPPPLDLQPAVNSNPQPDTTRNLSPSPLRGGDRSGGQNQEDGPKASLHPRPLPAGEGGLVIGSGTIGADVVEAASRAAPSVSDVHTGGSETKARRQMQGAHLLGLGGEGVTRSWREGAEATAIETRWHHGVLVGLPGMHFHCHLAAGQGPARALDIQLGSAVFPMTRSRRRHYGDESVYASGSAEVP